MVNDKIRAYARWELEYRVAFNKGDEPEPEMPLVDRSKYRAPLQEGKEGIGA